MSVSKTICGCNFCSVPLWRLKSSRLFTQPFIHQRKYQRSASLAFVRGIHRWPANSPHKTASNTEKVSIWWRHHVLSWRLIGIIVGGWATYICVSKLAFIGSDNGLSPGRHQAIIWTNVGISLIRPLGTNFSEIYIEICIFSFKKVHLKMSAAKYRPYCPGLNVLTPNGPSPSYHSLIDPQMNSQDESSCCFRYHVN